MTLKVKNMHLVLSTCTKREEASQNVNLHTEKRCSPLAN
jgi:hypothetical protein